MIKTGMWHEDSGVNYTLSAEEADEIVVTKLENMTLRVVTAQVCIYILANNQGGYFANNYVQGRPTYLCTGCSALPIFRKFTL